MRCLLLTAILGAATVGRAQTSPLEPTGEDGSGPIDASVISPRPIPGPPTEPVAVSRPSSWPGGPDEDAAPAEEYLPVEAPRAAAIDRGPAPVLTAGRFSPSRWSQQAHAAAWQDARPTDAAGQRVYYDQAVTPSQYSAPAPQYAPRTAPPPPAAQAPPQYAPQPGAPPYAPQPYAPPQPVAAAPPSVAVAQPAPSAAPATKSLPFSTAGGTPGDLRTDFPFKLPSYSVDNATIVARINGEAILAGELLDVVHERFAENEDRLPKDAEQLEQLRQQLMRAMLPGLLDTKMIAMQARKKIPADNLPKVEGELGKEFDKEYLGKMLDQHRLESRAELDQKFKKWGTSLARVRKSHMEGLLARKWMFMQLKLNEEITREEMLNYYRQHAADYEHEAKARWEQLTVRVSSEQPKPVAYAKLAQLGNQLFAGGDFAALARAHSEGSTAQAGGEHDWTTRGSLKSTVIDAALFTLPVGTPSAILEDESGFHIVRVIEREEAGRTAFEDAQPEIRQALREQRFQSHRTEYVAKVKAECQIWTMYDDETRGADRVTQQPRTPVR